MVGDGQHSFIVDLLIESKSYVSTLNPILEIIKKNQPDCKIQFGDTDWTIVNLFDYMDRINRWAEKRMYSLHLWVFDQIDDGQNIIIRLCIAFVW